MLVKLFDEIKIMKDLEAETVALIHSTSLVQAIKRLISAYDIIHLNLDINAKFPNYDGPIWDNAAMEDLRKIYRELAVYHKADFEPSIMFESYSRKMNSLFWTIDMRYAI